MRRLDVSAHQLTQAITAWISVSGAEASATFAAEPTRVQQSRHRTQTFLRWAAIAGAVIGLIRILALLANK